jgi:hypothetical protein
MPRAEFVSLDGLGNGRNVRGGTRAAFSRRRQRLELPGAHESKHLCRAPEHEIQRPVQHISDRRRAATIGDVRHFDAGESRELHDRYM